MTKFLEYLNEKTFRIGGDVDLVYKKIFHPYIKLLPNFDMFMDKVNKDKIKSNEYFFEVIFSHELKTKDCKEAHEVNPIGIKGGIFDTSSYVPSLSLIKLSLNIGVINILQQNRSKESIENLIGTAVSKRFFNELSPANLKGTIYHELSHWLNDSLHNKNISKRLKKAQQTQNYDILKKHGDAIFTDYELDAQVHAIKQLKRDYRKDWDKLTWYDIIEVKSSFDVIFSRLKHLNSKDQNEYFQRMIKRLNREGLLGKGLRNSFIKAINKV